MNKECPETYIIMMQHVHSNQFSLLAYEMIANLNAIWHLNLKYLMTITMSLVQEKELSVLGFFLRFAFGKEGLFKKKREGKCKTIW